MIKQSLSLWPGRAPGDGSDDSTKKAQSATLTNMLGVMRGHYPSVHALLVDRHRRGREIRVGESANGNDQICFKSLGLIVDRRAALRTKVEPCARTLITGADELRRPAGDRHIFPQEPGLLPKDTASTALASQTVTDRNADRIAHDLCGKLTTATRCKSG